MGFALRAGFAALCSAVFAFAADFGRAPYLQNVGTDHATVVWSTRGPGGGAVEYSTDTSYSRSVQARVRELFPEETGYADSNWEFRAELTGLNAATEYYYRVRMDGQDVTPRYGTGDPPRFRTTAPGPFAFLAIGDSGEGNDQQRQLAALMAKEPGISLFVHSGDVAYPMGRFAEFEEHHFAVYAEIMRRIPFFPSIGNHEYYTNDAAPYLSVHALPSGDVPLADRGRYYSFDWSNVHFVALDSNRPLADAIAGKGGMLDWLERDLARTRQFWKIIYFHHPPYPTGDHIDDPVSADVRRVLVPILERYRVPLVICGHEHNYQRRKPSLGGRVLSDGLGTVGEGTTYIVTGGGGGVLFSAPARPELVTQRMTYHYVRFDVQGAKILLRAIELPGAKEIDSVTLAPVPQVTSEGVVNAASFTPSLAPGALISVFGQFLAPSEAQAGSLPLPRELSETKVTIGARELPLIYVSAGQINAQLPFDVSGPVRLRVFNPNGQSEVTVNVADTAPAIFTGLAPVTHANGVPVSTAAPAEAGETVIVYLTGLGSVNGAIQEGDPAPRQPLLTVRAAVSAQVGNLRVVPSFAGLAPGFVGLYQVNVAVPEQVASGSYGLQFEANGKLSNSVVIPVRGRASPEPTPIEP